MDVTIVYNDDAGSGVSASEIKGVVERHGHRVVRMADKDEDIDAVLDQPGDLVVAAGGDGTVASIAKKLAGRSRSLAMLPLGTANNIARTFGWTGPLDDIVGGWRLDAGCDVDLGVVRGAFGERRFIESVGGGLVAHVIAALDSVPAHDDFSPDRQIGIAVDCCILALPTLAPAAWSLRLDGTPVEGHFLLVEVLNIGSIGPRFVVAPDADPTDGHFTVALATEIHRGALLDYWQARRRGEPATVEIERRQARDVELVADDLLHIDDELVRPADAGRLRLHLERATVRILTGSSGVVARNFSSAGAMSTRD